MLFRSGSLILGEMGWWKLMHSFTPAVAAHIIQDMGRVKPKNRQRNQTTMDGNLFFEKVTELGYKDLVVNDEESLTQISDPVPHKKRRVDSDELSAISSTSYLEYFDSDSRNETTEDIHDDPLLALSSHNSSYSEMEIFRGFDFAQTNPLPPSDSSSTHSFQQSTLNYDSDSHSHSPCLPIEMQSDESEDKLYVPKLQAEIKPRSFEKDKPVIRLIKESLFSTQPNSLVMPWIENDNLEIKKGLVKLSEYEEVQLLKRVEDLIQKMKDPNKKAELRRFRAKLSVRRLKRHKRLPVFDFDKTLRILGGYSTEDPRSVNNVERVLDRFQTSYLMDNLSGTVAPSSLGPLLVSQMELTPFRSPYSGAILKPYIRRDAETVPLWLKLMNELLQKTNRHVENYSPPQHATIDYSYVRPQHIAAVNSFCAQHFWLGIDLTEALQYPEFSCVVTYKRLVIGCAFLVPDVKYNEAYISFILTRPGWQGAKIATFMLYHLLQVQLKINTTAQTVVIC
ncbi:Cysteine-rich protein 2-binding protein [Eumeta japonica]|uniref:Cysteine-rich protein 2-binding protein n=1 Tax=Eumeta variegata TaxID=151549 RepID=A0A4C1YL83_EUMVA|nr:Cysteine-rich protein 2-binding protein [Eumeta japonica]